MNDDSKDENLTQNPASQSGFVADYTQSEGTAVPAEEQAAQEETAAPAAEDQPTVTPVQDDVSENPTAETPVEAVTAQEETTASQPEAPAPVGITQEDTAPVPIEPAMEEVPGIDVSAGEAEVDAGVGVDEVEVIEPIDDTLDALSGDL